MLILTMRNAHPELITLLNKWKGPLSLLHVTSEEIAIQGSGPDLVFITSEKIRRLECEDAVFLLKDAQCLPCDFSCARAVAVVDSSAADALQAVARRRIPALTCGLSGTDTFNFSSYTRDSAVIALSRPVRAFDNTLVEPYELPVSCMSLGGAFNLLACAAAYTLLGKKNPLLFPGDAPPLSIKPSGNDGGRGLFFS